MSDKESHETDETSSASSDSAAEDTGAASDQPDQGAASLSDGSVQRPDAAAAAEPEDELPESEELTPEIVEEEAIRGDFMLRWAAIFLTVLFGFTQISDTRVLVHVRSGDAMRDAGFLPWQADSLSYALPDGQSVSNVNWLFDHIISLVHAFGGATGLTVFKALLGGLIAWILSQISLRNIPTWWSSICVALTAAAISVDLVPATDLITLLGLAVVMLLLHRHSHGELQNGRWKIPLLIAVWANLDPHAYMGALAVLLYAIGDFIRALLEKRQNHQTASNTSGLLPIAGLAVLALLINPSPIASLTSVVTTYTSYYPSLAALHPLLDSDGNPLLPAVLLDGRTEYHSLLAPGILAGFELAWVAGLAIIVIAMLVLLLSWSREDIPWAVLFLAFTGMAIVALHELPAAAMVAAVTAGLSAQRWYGRKFSLEYTTKPSEVLFSRGGRAVTVLAFAALSFFVVTDRVPTRAPIGVGFEADLNTTIQTVGEQLAELSDDGNIFHTVLNQGDMLVWHGRRSFIDSRMRPFGSVFDAQTPAHEFNALRWSIIQADTTAARKPTDARPFLKDWRERLKKLGVTTAMIRVAPPGVPAYSIAGRLAASREWVMAHRGPSAIFFRLVDSPEERQTGYSIVHEAFRRNITLELTQPEFARPKDFYQRWLYKTRPHLSAPLRNAQHFLTVDCQIPEQTVFQIAQAAGKDPDNKDLHSLLGNALAGPVLAVRNAAQAAAEDPQNAIAHQYRGMAYKHLNRIESAIAAAYNGSAPSDLRYLQAVCAFRQVVTIEPDNAPAWYELMTLYQSQGRTGLALKCVDRVLEIDENRLANDPNATEQLARMYESQKQWRQQREQVKQEVEKFLTQDMPEDPQQQAQTIFGVVQELYSQAQLDLAIEVASERLDLLNPIAPFRLIYGHMLLESGQLEEGALILNQLAAAIIDNPADPAFVGMKWHLPVAVSRIVRGDYEGASEIWSDQAELFVRAARTPEVIYGQMRALPLVPAVETGIGTIYPAWPLSHLQTASFSMSAVPAGRYQPTFLRAVADIESGNVANARFLMKGLVLDGGDHSLRPLACVYLRHMSDDAAELIKESTLDSLTDFAFPEVETTGSDSAEPEPKPGDKSPAEDEPQTGAGSSEKNDQPSDQQPNEN